MVSSAQKSPTIMRRLETLAEAVGAKAGFRSFGMLASVTNVLTRSSALHHASLCRQPGMIH
jgi:hypothetical protein